MVFYYPLVSSVIHHNDLKNLYLNPIADSVGFGMSSNFDLCHVESIYGRNITDELYFKDTFKYLQKWHDQFESIFWQCPLHYQLDSILFIYTNSVEMNFQQNYTRNYNIEYHMKEREHFQIIKIIKFLLIGTYAYWINILASVINWTNKTIFHSGW